MARTFLALLLFACGDDSAPGADASPSCTADPECSDGVFCNGPEQCSASGTCSAGTAPCAAGQTCDEAADECRTMCEVTNDADGDGSRAPDCGGTDCDDSNPSRFPGNTEVCDVADLDEDCDPRTFGVRDADGDGAPDGLCCNGDGAERVCGTDCDDAVAGRNPSVPEVCGDSIDNDCDMVVDEGASVVCYRDDDRDTFAPEGAETMMACACPAGFTDTAPGAGTTDCSDAAAGGESFHPGAPELCDGLDNDCSIASASVSPEPSEDADGDMHSPTDATCAGGPFPRDDCKDDDADVVPGQTSYFTDPYCEPIGCDGFRIVGRGWVCDCGSVPTYDYDCSGTGTPEAAFARCAGALGPRCEMGRPDTCTGSGPSTTAAPSQCGTSVSYVQCSCNESSTAGIFNCEAAPAATRTLPCH